METMNNSDIDDMANKKDDQYNGKVIDLSDKRIKELLETDIEDLDIEHDFDQEMKFLSQDKIKKLMAELGELFHMAEDKNIVIEDYDEYMALLKDYLNQVNDLKSALKKYPKLANLIAILMSLSYRIEQAQTLATKKEEQKIATINKNDLDKTKSQTVSEQKVEKNQNPNKINVNQNTSSPKNNPYTHKLGNNPKAIKGTLGNKNVAFTPINYSNKKGTSNDFEFATLDRNGNIKFNKNAKQPKIQPVNKMPKPKKEKKNAPKVEKVFVPKDPKEKMQTQKISPSQQQRRLDAYNKDVAARAKSSPSGPNQMTR